MQITIDIPQELEQNLIRQAAQSNIPLQTLIIQVLHQFAQTIPEKAAQWSNIVLSYESESEFPTFESYRDELLSPDQSELF